MDGNKYAQWHFFQRACLGLSIPKLFQIIGEYLFILNINHHAIPQLFHIPYKRLIPFFSSSIMPNICHFGACTPILSLDYMDHRGLKCLAPLPLLSESLDMPLVNCVYNQQLNGGYSRNMLSPWRWEHRKCDSAFQKRFRPCPNTSNSNAVNYDDV